MLLSERQQNKHHRSSSTSTFLGSNFRNRLNLAVRQKTPRPRIDDHSYALVEHIHNLSLTNVRPHHLAQLKETRWLNEIEEDLLPSLEMSRDLDTAQWGLSHFWVDTLMESLPYTQCNLTLTQDCALFDGPDEMSAMITMTKDFSNEACSL